MATLLSQTPRLSPRPALSPSPSSSTPLNSFPVDGFSGACGGVSSIAAHHPIAKVEYCSEPTSRSCTPPIPRIIVHNGVTFDVVRPEELDHEVPVFGERRRKIVAPKPKKTLKRRRQEQAEEDNVMWEAKRRRLIQERVLEKEFISYTKEEMSLTEDGLRLPNAPSWLNMTRERQDDGNWGIFIARPSKKDIEMRWPEIIQALEPIGVEIGAVKIAFPSEYLENPLPIEELTRYISGSTSFPGPLYADSPLSDVKILPASIPIPVLASVPASVAAPAPAPAPVSASNLAPHSTLAYPCHSRHSRSPHPLSHADLIPLPRLDKNGIPKIWIVDQRLPLHPLSVSSLTPIYRVSSTNRRQIRGTKLLTSIHTYTSRERAIAAGDPHTEIFAPLTEAAVLARGRSWDRIDAGDTGGVSMYSSDNDADPYTRAYIGVGNPHLTSLPGNVMFDSKCKIVGIHTPFFYFGAAHTLFALHAEDYNAMSLNYHHFGADKIWRVVSPRCYHVVEDFVAARLLSVAAAATARNGRRLPDRRCSQFVRHASIYLPGETLKAAGARSIQFRQRPGELVITWPLAYHEGYNEGLNINEACGYGHKSWRRVFATGEEATGEAAIYRPCGARCTGGANPIILDFEPEAGSEVEGDDDDGDDISNIGEDEEVVTAVGWGAAAAVAADQGASRKRSKTVRHEENVEIKLSKSPRGKKAAAESEMAEDKIDHRSAASGPRRPRGGAKVTRRQPPPRVKATVEGKGKRPAKKRVNKGAGNEKVIDDDCTEYKVAVSTEAIAGNKRKRAPRK